MAPGVGPGPVTVLTVPGGARVGWRYWQLHPVSGLLRSVSHRSVGWPAGRPLRATCLGGGHPAPDPACECGIAAAPSLAGLRRLGLCLAPEPVVAGRAALWGRVVEDEGGGWRAEWAYPVSLAVVGDTVRPGSGGPDALAARLGAAYGVPASVVPLAEAVGEPAATLLANQMAALGCAPPANRGRLRPV